MNTSTNMQSKGQENLYKGLTDNECSGINGGGFWDKFREGARDQYTGLNDGLTGQERKDDNFNTLTGHTAGTTVRNVWKVFQR